MLYRLVWYVPLLNKNDTLSIFLINITILLFNEASVLLTFKFIDKTTRLMTLIKLLTGPVLYKKRIHWQREYILAV